MHLGDSLWIDGEVRHLLTVKKVVIHCFEIRVLNPRLLLHRRIVIESRSRLACIVQNEIGGDVLLQVLQLMLDVFKIIRPSAREGTQFYYVLIISSSGNSLVHFAFLTRITIRC